MGEYRGIMNLCRVLPQGTAAKLAVDKAIDRLSTIGSIREDIQRCRPSCLVSIPSVLHCTDCNSTHADSCRSSTGLFHGKAMLHVVNCCHNTLGSSVPL